MQHVTLKVAIVSLIVMGVYTLFANSIPQVESHPPQELKLTGEKLSGDELAALGEKIFYAKGTCAVCHSVGSEGMRAPDLAGVGMRAGEKREGVSAVAYLFESLIDPGVFIVEGFGNIMPAANKPPIGLNPSELMATVAYLQSLGGPVTVTADDIPEQVREGGGGPAPAAVADAVVAGEAVKGGEVFGRLCVACHKIKGQGGDIGPDLSVIGSVREEEYIRESILNPAAVITEGYPPAMPPIFAAQLSVQDFNDLVAYLTTLKEE